MKKIIIILLILSFSSFLLGSVQVVNGSETTDPSTTSAQKKVGEVEKVFKTIENRIGEKYNKEVTELNEKYKPQIEGSTGEVKERLIASYRREYADIERRMREEWTEHFREDKKLAKDYKNLHEKMSQQELEMYHALINAESEEEFFAKLGKLREHLVSKREALSNWLSLTKKYEDLVSTTKGMGGAFTSLAISLLASLFMISFLMLVVTQSDGSGGNPIKQLVMMTLKYFILMFIIQTWATIISQVMASALTIIGRVVKGGDLAFDPGIVWDNLTFPIEATLKSVYWLELDWVILCCIAYAGAILVTISVFMLRIEFHVVLAFTVFIVPFVMLKETESIGFKAISICLAQMLKLALFGIFYGIFIQDIYGIGYTPLNAIGRAGMTLMLKYALILFILNVLLSKVGSFISAVVGGGGMGGSSSSDISSPFMVGVGTAMGVMMTTVKMGGLLIRGLGKGMKGGSSNKAERLKNTKRPEKNTKQPEKDPK